MTKSKKDPLRVLSLDGGGMRGVYTAAFLERLVSQQARINGVDELDLGLGFDLIVGTSTGAIIGCAAAAGCQLEKVVELYRIHGSKIFPHRIGGKLSAIYRAFNKRRFVRKGDAALRAALSDVLGNVTMLDVYKKRGISLAIPTIRMTTHRAWVFKKTPQSGVRDEKYPLVDVCMASSAAPIYRSLASIKDPNSNSGVDQVFADGGLWANNPVMVAMVDAISMADDDQPIEIYSLGTCPRPEGEHINGDDVHRSLLEWKLGADVGPLAIAAQEFAYDNMARLLANQFSKLGRSVRIIRFPRKDVPASMMPFLALDDSRDEAVNRLIEQAHTDADMTRSACDDPRNEDGQLIKSLLDALPKRDTNQVLVDMGNVATQQTKDNQTEQVHV